MRFLFLLFCLLTFESLAEISAVTVKGEVVTISQPSVLIFMDDGCPISKRYMPTLNEIYKKRGKVHFFGVFSNPTMSWKKAAELQKTFQLKFPVILDANGALAEKFKPSTVPQAFVYNNFQTAYSGAIDNLFNDIGEKRAKATKFYLKDAIADLNADRQIKLAKTKPIGCVFEAWDNKENEVTYNRNIAPIMATNCINCHREGDIGPFPLNNYEQVKKRAKMIARVCRKKIMPPWKADPSFRHFRDEKVLTEREIAILEAWVKQGKKEGSQENKVKIANAPETEWRGGTPDVVFKMPEAYKIPASQEEDIYRYFVIPNAITKDLQVIGMDFKPGAKAVVHHANFFVDYSGKARKKDAESPNEVGFSVFGKGSFMSYDSGNDQGGQIGAWAPGTSPYKFKDGLGFYLPRGGDIVIEIHYHPDGKEHLDQSSIGLYLAKKPIKQNVESIFIGSQDLSIPAGNKEYWRHIYMDVTADMEIIDVTPHMHYIGKEFIMVATTPDKKRINLIRVPRWDFRYQDVYVYDKPIFIPKGSRIDCWFSFDNSATNPFNPNDPPEKVNWGWNTEDEMLEVYITVLTKDIQKLFKASYDSWLRSAYSHGPLSEKDMKTKKRVWKEW